MVYLLKQLDPTIHTVSVGSAKAALKTVAEGKPFDLVLLDYDMPGTNGIKGMGMIQKDHPEQIVGIISGRTEPQLC